MTNNHIKYFAMQQSAVDLNCEARDFVGTENRVVISKLHDRRKKYIKSPNFCKFVCYGYAVVASVDKKIEDFIGNFIKDRIGFRCFEGYGILSKEFIKYNKQIGTVEYYLPDLNKSRITNPDFDVKIYIEDEIRRFYSDDRFHMALGYFPENSDRRDVIAVAGYDSDKKIMGIAGASNDADKMWQVGIDVMPEFRNRGVAAVLVSIITDEILKKNIIPFYGTAWSHIASKNVAVNSGYKPAWVELSAYDIEID